MTMMNSNSILLNGMQKLNIRIILVIIGLCCSFSLMAQQPFKGKFANSELKMNCVLNLYADSVDVPGLEGLETCYGYISGNINGNWVILRVDKLTDDTAVARITCDRGNDATDITFQVTPDGITFSQADAVIKTVNGNKYVKLPKKIIELKRLK